MTGKDSDEHEAQYTAADVKKAAGLSYRQLNDWEQKGVMPDRREDAAAWRKYTMREVFALMVSREIRVRFGVPVESLAWMHKVMLQPGADHFRAAVEIMARGMSVLLLTDLREGFVMDSDLEFEDLLHAGYFRGEHEEAYLLLKLNPLVNRLLACLKEPLELKIRDDLYAAVRNARGEFVLRSQEELEVLRLIRSREYASVTIHLNDDKIVRAEGEREHGQPTNAQLLKILDQNAFQTVSVVKHDGQIVRVIGREPIRLGARGPLQKDPVRGPKRPRRR